MENSRGLKLALLYAALIVYLSLFPGAFSPVPGAGFLWVPLDGRRLVLDAVLNILLYIPLGSFLGLTLGGYPGGRVASVLLGASLSFLLEYHQTWSPSRFNTLNNLLANSVGSLGCAVAESGKNPRVIGPQ